MYVQKEKLYFIESELSNFINLKFIHFFKDIPNSPRREPDSWFLNALEDTASNKTTPTSSKSATTELSSSSFSKTPVVFYN